MLLFGESRAVRGLVRIVPHVGAGLGTVVRQRRARLPPGDPEALPGLLMLRARTLAASGRAVKPQLPVTRAPAAAA